MSPALPNQQVQYLHVCVCACIALVGNAHTPAKGVSVVVAMASVAFDVWFYTTVVRNPNQ